VCGLVWGWCIGLGYIVVASGVRLLVSLGALWVGVPGKGGWVMGETVLLTGGFGFIGSHVREGLGGGGVGVRVLARRFVEGCDVVLGDLADVGSLRGVCEGVGVLVHAASVVSGDQVRCRVVNELGTAALMAEARRAGVGRIVYVGTAAVYGDGVHRSLVEDGVVPVPVSPASRSRLAAEGAVRAVGGTVLRPMFVYGAGDRWFVPMLSWMARRFGALPEGGRARLSVISVHALARAVCALATGPAEGLAGAVLHAAHPEPVAVAELVAVLAEHALAPALVGDVGYAQARAAWDVGSSRLSLISFDHFYDSSRLWSAVGPLHGEGFREAFPRYAQWYRDSCRERPDQ